MRILVTGAAGLVGAATVGRLTARGHVVRAMVHRRAAPSAATETIAGSVGDPTVWRRAVAGVDAIVHAAGAMTQDEHVLQEVNVRGTELGCAAARAAGCPRFVLLSSAAVYAPGPMLAADEDTAVAAADAYGRSKSTAEALARSALAGAATILRPVSVYSSTRPSPLLDALRALVAAGRVPVAGRGQTPIDLLHSDDLAAAIAAAAEGRGAGGLFNVAGPEPAPYLALVHLAADTLGIEVETVCIDDGDAEFAFPPWLCAVARTPRTVSWARASALLGYAPVRSWSREIRRALMPTDG